MDQMLRMSLDELHGAWRFRWPAMALAWLIAVGGMVYVLRLADIYEASAQVFLDTSDPLARDARASDADAQLKVAFVRQTLLSTPNLERVARETDLDLRASTPEEFQRLVAGLHRTIVVRSWAETGRRAGGRFEANLYDISYRDMNRDAAQRVVQVLLNTFQSQSVEGDLRDDLQALAFLDNQMDEYRRRLEEAENRVADFRRRNSAIIGDGAGFFSRLANLEEQLRGVQADLRIASDKRNALAAQALVSDGAAQGESGATSLAELETQVTQTERQVDELRLRYTDEHPSVVSTRETLVALQNRLERRRIELGPLLATGAGGAVIENVRIEINKTEIEIAEMRGRERDLNGRIAELRQKVDIAPQLEAELAGLNRDHSVLRAQYESLLQRRELLSFEIDRKRQGKQLEFRIIEPPLAPQKPVAPERARLLLLVMFAALGAGAGLSYLLHMLKPVFITSNSVFEELNIPVLGAVSMAWTGKATWRRRRAEVLFVAGVLALLGVFGLVFGHLPRAVELTHHWLA